MKTEYTINVRRFPVMIRDERTGETFQDHIVLDKVRLQACQLVGQSAEDLIYRIYNRQGFRVLEIGKTTKHTLSLALDELIEA